MRQLKWLRSLSLQFFYVSLNHTTFTPRVGKLLVFGVVILLGLPNWIPAGKDIRFYVTVSLQHCVKMNAEK